MNWKNESITERIFSIIRPMWMLLRKFSPKGTYIKLGDYCIKDSTIPKVDRLFSRTRNKVDQTSYEENTTAAIRKYVKKGELVTLIEASKIRACDISKVWEKYKLKGTVIHGFVGSIISTWGDLNGAEKINNIPKCDILELDCEGAEREILSKLDIEPRVIIVESHGHLGSPSSLVKSLLISKGYRILDEMVENLENDIVVFVGE